MAHTHSTAFVSALLVAAAASVVVPVLAQGPPGPTHRHRSVGRVGAAVPRGSAGAHSGSRHRRLSRPADQRSRASARRQLGRVAPDAARTSVQAASGRLLAARPRQPAHLARVRSAHAAARRVPHAHLVAAARADDLDGRPSASARVRRAHVAGVLDRQVGRRHADGDDHASEDGVDSPQRHPAQRQGRAHRALRAPRQLPDADLGDRPIRCI